jgi:hypothetical protein
MYVALYLSCSFAAISSNRTDDSSKTARLSMQAVESKTYCLYISLVSAHRSAATMYTNRLSIKVYTVAVITLQATHVSPVQ